MISARRGHEFLLDQDVYAVTAQFLRDLGHDVLPAGKAGLAEAEDQEILNAGSSLDRIVVTRDRDFGRLVFLEARGLGVVYLRISPATLSAVHSELGKVLGAFDEDELRNSFIVIEPGGHRMRRLRI